MFRCKEEVEALRLRVLHQFVLTSPCQHLTELLDKDFPTQPPLLGLCRDIAHHACVGDVLPVVVKLGEPCHPAGVHHHRAHVEHLGSEARAVQCPGQEHDGVLVPHLVADPLRVGFTQFGLDPGQGIRRLGPETDGLAITNRASEDVPGGGFFWFADEFLAGYRRGLRTWGPKRGNQ